MESRQEEMRVKDLLLKSHHRFLVLFSIKKKSTSMMLLYAIPNVECSKQNECKSSLRKKSAQGFIMEWYYMDGYDECEGDILSDESFQFRAEYHNHYLEL